MKTNRMEETKVEETIDIKTTNGNLSETIDMTTTEDTPKATQRNREQKQVIEETLILETETKQQHKHHHHHHHHEHHQKKNGEVIEEILIEETESTKRHHHKHHHQHEEIKEVIEETIPAPPQTSPPFLTPTEDLEAEVIWKPQAYWVPPQLPTSPEPSTTSTDELAGVAWQAEFNLNNPEAVESTPSTTSSSPTGLDQRPLSKVGETVQMLESIQATILPPKPLMKSWLNFSNSRPSLMLQTQVIEETEEITPVPSPGIEEEDKKVEEDLTKVEQTVKILDELEESLQSTMPPSPPPGWLDDSEEDEEDILEISSIPVVQQGISSPSPTPSPPAQGLGQQEFHSRQNQLLHLLIPRPKLEQKELVVETEEVEESLESSTSQNPSSSQLEIVQTELIVESSQSTSSAGPSQVQIGLNLEGSPPAPAGTRQTGLNSEGPPYAPGGTMQMVPNLPNSLEQMGPNTEGPPTAPAGIVQIALDTEGPPTAPVGSVQMGLTLEGPPTAPAGIVETELIVESLETTPTPTPRPSPATQRTMKTELQLPLSKPTSMQTEPNLEIEQTQLVIESLESTPTATPTPTPPPSPTRQRILKAGLNLPLTSSNSTKQMEQTEQIVESLESTPTPTPSASPVRSLPIPLPFPLPIPLSTKPQTLPLEVVQTELIVNRTPPSNQSLQQAEFIAELNSIVQPPSPSPTVEVVETVYVEDSSKAQPTLEVVETELIVTPVLAGELALDSSDKLGKRYSVSAALADQQQQPQQPEVPEKRKICCNCRCIIA